MGLKKDISLAKYVIPTIAAGDTLIISKSDGEGVSVNYGGNVNNTIYKLNIDKPCTVRISITIKAVYDYAYKFSYKTPTTGGYVSFANASLTNGQTITLTKDIPITIAGEIYISTATASGIGTSILKKGLEVKGSISMILKNERYGKDLYPKIEVME